MGIMYAKLSGETKEAVINRFFGVFFFFFQSGQIWGNLISAKILERNSTMNENATCGIDFVPSKDANDSVHCGEEVVEDRKVYLCAVFICSAMASSVVFLFLLDNFRRESEEKKKGFSISLLLVTLRNLKDVNQALFVPLTIWSGIEQGFLVSDYNKAWVDCAMGIDHIGYTMIAFGLFNSSCSVLFGRLVKTIGRIPFFVLAALVNVAALLTMVLWSPVNTANKPVFFVLAAMWGVSDAVWQTQINALYGVLFMENQEAGFANYRLWESLGFIIAFIYADLLSVRAKTLILFGVLGVGMLGYFLIEIRERLRSRQSISPDNKEKGEDTKF